jgi:branched-chain amino acid transport system permease protein
LAAIGAAGATIGAALVTAAGSTTPLAGFGLGFFAAAFAGAMYGAVAGHFTITRVGGESGQPSLIATVGLSLALMEYLRLAQGAATVWFPPVWSQNLPLARSGEIVTSITPVSLFTGAIGILAGLTVLGVMRRSASGGNGAPVPTTPRLRACSASTSAAS